MKFENLFVVNKISVQETFPTLPSKICKHKQYNHKLSLVCSAALSLFEMIRKLEIMLFL